MSLDKLKLTANQIAELQKPSAGFLRGMCNGARFTAETVIPDYSGNVSRRYRVNGAGYPAGPEFRNFGLLVAFDEPVELFVYDDEWRLDHGLKNLVAAFGPVILRNAYLASRKRQEGQRNIFESLAFHLDRGHHMDNRYSLFIRDPFDPIQRRPRESSTLILSYNATQLQAAEEGEAPNATKPRYNIFSGEDVEKLFGNIMIRQPWTAPAGTGELCILDNRTVYHASYYKRDRGYPIGVRYLY